MTSSLGDEPLRRLMTTDYIRNDGVSAWKNLQKLYRGISPQDVRALWFKLINLKLSEHKDLEECAFNAISIKAALEDLPLDRHDESEGRIKTPNDLVCAIYVEGLGVEYLPIVNHLKHDSAGFQAFFDLVKRVQTYKDHDLAKITTIPSNVTTVTPNTLETAAAGRPGGLGVVECYNCRRRHAGGMRSCADPCRICGD